MNIERVLDRPLYPDEIRHYGVKGMKWGVRRSGKKLVSSSKKLVSSSKKLGSAAKKGEKYLTDMYSNQAEKGTHSYRRPIKAAKAKIREFRKHPIAAALETPASNKRINADIRRQIAASYDKKIEKYTKSSNTKKVEKYTKKRDKLEV